MGGVLLEEQRGRGKLPRGPALGRRKRSTISVLAKMSDSPAVWAQLHSIQGSCVHAPASYLVDPRSVERVCMVWLTIFQTRYIDVYRVWHSRVFLDAVVFV